MTKTMIKELDFPLFVAIWNKLQNLQTPPIHYRITDWLQQSVIKNDKRLLLMAFRGCGKSTLTGLYAAWKIYCDPSIRILVLSADEALARKMVRNVRRILERHPFTSHLKPQYLDQWGTDRFTVVRDQELRDPSMLARGISANLTGCRADLIICDDVEVPNTCDTTEKRQDLRTRLLETDFILTPDGTKLFVGTPHNYHSIYTESPAADHQDDIAFLNDYKRLVLPLLTKRGKSAWPERFKSKDIEQIKLTAGPNKFASQMMLEPVNIRNSRLNPDLLRIYDGDLAYVKELNRLEINNIPLISASAWWDPAFGAEGGDRSVFTAVFADDDSNFYLHHLSVLQPEIVEHIDMASAQCEEVARVAKELRVPSIAIETNGLGKYLPGILRRKLNEQRVPCAVIEVNSRQSKELRILEAFDVILAARRLHVQKDVMKGPFATELREWQPGRNKGHDDCLDAVAGALSLQPVRIGASPVIGRQPWMRATQTGQADTNFKV